MAWSILLFFHLLSIVTLQLWAALQNMCDSLSLPIRSARHARSATNTCIWHPLARSYPNNVQSASGEFVFSGAALAWYVFDLTTCAASVQKLRAWGLRRPAHAVQLFQSQAAKRSF
ncbi:hypothetical protein P280DRAFT_467434 [Massarina eburnea CBS 473.64]|uniref:Secreted protein n=1 Tax=Massarina eburnea CBS 473.64 TaxID=1395130 RepID=A0A6A6S873_9PLEO|nr:hypothetical protein P280DRAFT_467434 [Massarina eburnea CBS 473.64]